MGKRIFEIFLVVVIMFHILYFIGYKYYFQDICNKYGGKDELNITVSYGKLAKCKDSIICEINNIEKKENKVSSWSCDKVKVNTFSPEHYYNIFKKSVLN